MRYCQRHRAWQERPRALAAWNVSVLDLVGIVLLLFICAALVKGRVWRPKARHLDNAPVSHVYET